MKRTITIVVLMSFVVSAANAADAQWGVPGDDWNVPGVSTTATPMNLAALQCGVQPRIFEGVGEIQMEVGQTLKVNLVWIDNHGQQCLPMVIVAFDVFVVDSPWNKPTMEKLGGWPPSFKVTGHGEECYLVAMVAFSNDARWTETLRVRVQQRSRADF